MTAPTVSAPSTDPTVCTKCGDAPRWRTGQWCSACIMVACCVPMVARGWSCPHPSLQRLGGRRRHLRRGSVGL